MPRIKILKNHEVRQFDKPKQIPQDEKPTYFNLDSGPRKMSEFTKNESLLGYVLLKGYFVAYKKIFQAEKFRREDVKFCCDILNINFEKYSFDHRWYKESTFRLHKGELLDYYGFTPFKSYKNEVKLEALELVKKALRPKKIFLSLVRHLFESKVEIPEYGTLASIITDALNVLESEIINKLNELLTPEDRELLDQFISLPALDGEVSTHNPYLLTTLKKPNQETRTSKIQESVEKFHVISDVFLQFESILKNTSISESLVNYYAGWMMLAEQPQFNAIKNPEKKYLYVLSLITYQYRIRQDLFVEIFLKSIRSFLNSVDKRIKDDFINQRQNPTKQVKESRDRIVSSIDTQESKLTKVRDILSSSEYSSEHKVQIALEVIDTKPNIKEQIIREFQLLENTVSQKLKDEMFYEIVEKGSMRLSRKLKNLFLTINFNKEASDQKIYESVSHYQIKKSNISQIPPLDYLNDEQRKYVIDEGGVNNRLYKCLLFIESSEHIKAGSLNLKYSNNYRSINDYMIEQEVWNENKEKLLHRSNLSKLSDFQQVLKVLKDQMHDQYVETNDNAGKNPHLSFNRSDKPVLETPKNDPSQNEFVKNLLAEGDVIPLVDVLADVAETTEFLEAFTHFALKGSKRNPDNETLFAGIIALGCNIGVRKMGKITKELGAEKLENTVRWHFTRENLSEANNRILEVTDRLAIPKFLKELINEMHTSSDGQKFGVSVPSIHSSYSYKYFGTGKGVSAYSFIDEYSRVFYDTVISSSEREAAYVLDGLLYNDVVESSIHSTDTHGYTEVIFGICNSLGIEFAPRIKSPGSQIIYTFKDRPRKHYEDLGYKVLPEKAKYINVEILEEQWDNILRLLVSIKTKKVTASVLMKRLSSYSKNHPLYRALKELGRIHKTVFLLKYFDDSEFRQRIEKQLNKGELWHKFAKEVWFGNNQEFTVGEQEAQELALSCRNLIQNAIVLWNYLSLTMKLSQLKEKESQKIIENLSSSSLISWKHINIHGEYDFHSINSKSETFNLEELLEYKINDKHLIIS
ncbi:Tn3 family transposase [Reichenbachiella sp.]|uniref:Tn3 family transposase n=1 Tax=Reichenbachiella sp. TaxID=2184521 RepID=UPI003BAEECBD